MNTQAFSPVSRGVSGRKGAFFLLLQLLAPAVRTSMGYVLMIPLMPSVTGSQHSHTSPADLAYLLPPLHPGSE